MAFEATVQRGGATWDGQEAYTSLYQQSLCPLQVGHRLAGYM